MRRAATEPAERMISTVSPAANLFREWLQEMAVADGT